jgi:hypothetical protein
VTIRVKKPDIPQVLQKYAPRLGAFQDDSDIVVAQRERCGWDAHDLRLLESNDLEDTQ